MCIVCDIKKAVDASKPATDHKHLTEAREEVMTLVRKLAEGLETSLTVAQEVAQANPGAFSDEQRDRMQGAADLLNDRGDGAGVLGLLLAALLGGAKIETHHIELRDGESPEDAIARHLGERGEQTTKH